VNIIPAPTRRDVRLRILVVAGSALVVAAVLLGAYLNQFGPSCYGPQVFGVEYLGSSGIDAFGSSVEQMQQLVNDAKRPGFRGSPAYIKAMERILDEELLCRAKTNALAVEISLTALVALVAGIWWVTGRLPRF